ncbi:MAG: PAS domain-containing protein [Chromatiales bacterium]|nr:PAS domain-containing protein [Chromatiales bacterium]
MTASEEPFRNLVEGSIQGVIIHRDWKPLFVNQAYIDILGYSSSAEILDQESIEHHHAPRERARLWANQKSGLSGQDDST